MKISFMLVFIYLFASCVSHSTTGIGTPVLILPQDGSMIGQNPPIFVWHRIEDAIEYNLQVADNAFDSAYTFTIDLSCHPDTSYSPLGAIDAGTYYWRVQAIAGG